MDKNDRIFLQKLCAGESAGIQRHWKGIFETVSKAPKADLHCHMGGSMRPGTLKWLAGNVPGLDWSYCDRAFGFSIAQRIADGDIDEVKRYLEYRKKHGSLSDYMLAYSLPKTVLATEDVLRRVAFEVCEDNYLDGVRYLELRFNPWMLTGRVKPGAYIKALADGLGEAAGRYPELEAVLLLSLIKDYEPELAGRVLDESLEANEDPSVHGLIKGVDSAGNEIGFRPERYADIFARARRAGLSVVCHAGEAFAALEDGITMIDEAIDMLGAKRIGHGLAAGIDATALKGSEDLNGNRYDTKRVERIIERQKELRERLRREKIPVEICPSSNVHTGNVRCLEEHPLRVFLSDKVPVAICTDNRWVSHTKLSWEIVRMAKTLKLDLPVIEEIVRTPFRYKLNDLQPGIQ